MLGQLGHVECGSEMERRRRLVGTPSWALKMGGIDRMSGSAARSFSRSVPFSCEAQSVAALNAYHNNSKPFDMLWLYSVVMLALSSSVLLSAYETFKACTYTL